MKRAIRIGAIVVGVIVVILLILPFMVNVNAFRPKLESELSSALGRQVKIGNLNLSLLSGSVSADDISIADDPAYSREAFVTAKALKVGVDVMPLIFSKTLHVTALTLDEPQITLLHGANGNWNFTSIGGSSPAPANSAPANSTAAKSASANSQATKTSAESGSALSVDKLNVNNGRLIIGVAGSAQKPTIYDKVNLEVTDFSATAQFPFTLTAASPGGGDISLKGKCGPLNAGNADATPFDASVTVRKLDLAASGFVQPSTGIQGIADFDGMINSNGQDAKTSGTLKADKLKLAEKGSPSPRTVEVKYAVDHNLKAESGTVTQGDVSIGKAVAHLTGSYQTHGQNTTVNMRLDGNNMPVDDLEAALPAVGVVLPSGSRLQGGSLSTNLAIAGPTDKLVITGPVRLSNAKLSGFDLGSKLSAISALSGRQASSKDTSIQNLSANVRVAPEGTQANDINLTIPALGVVTGAGTVSPSGALNFKMVANLSGGSAGGMVQKVGLGGQGGVPFMIEGTTSNPQFVPDVKGMATSAVGQAISKQLGGGKGSNPAGALGGLFGKKH